MRDDRKKRAGVSPSHPHGKEACGCDRVVAKGRLSSILFKVRYAEKGEIRRTHPFPYKGRQIDLARREGKVKYGGARQSIRDDGRLEKKEETNVWAQRLWCKNEYSPRMIAGKKHAPPRRKLRLNRPLIKGREGGREEIGWSVD